MQLKTILNRVQKQRSFVYGQVRLLENRRLEIEIDVVPRRNSRARCSGCGRTRPGARQEPRLEELLRYNLRSVRAYLLKEDFQSFWEYVSPYWAGQFLDRWCTRVMRSRLDPMKKVARSLRNHRPLILNWFRARGAISAGTVEGFNNKAKLTMRKAYGFRTDRAMELALYHTLGALPEPGVTHRIC